MDAIVEKALAKWPHVPHCYGWLALDARGNWRMRNEYAQQHDLPGDKITQPSLMGFIRRNYTHDEQGRWYFQNGPQRVYVDLEAAPYIVRTDPAGFVLHTGEPLRAIDAAWLTERGRLFLKEKERIALLDDRDMGECLSLLYMGANPVADDQLMIWLNQAAALQIDAMQPLMLKLAGRTVAVEFIMEDRIAERFCFVKKPRLAA